jgi:hypothetical protein
MVGEATSPAREPVREARGLRTSDDKWGKPVKRIAQVLIGALCVALPISAATTAGAARTPTLKSLSGSNIENGFASYESRDGTCPDSNDSGAPFEDAHQLLHANIVKTKYWEELGINLCWYNTSALGGDYVDTGSTWELSIPSGTLKGTVTGGESNSSSELIDLTLTIASGTGSLSGLTGELDFWGCGYGASAFLASGLRTTPKGRYPAACFPS